MIFEDNRYHSAVNCLFLPSPSKTNDNSWLESKIAEISWKASIGHLFQKSHSLRSSYPFPFPEFVSSDVVVFTDYQHCCDLLHMTIRVEWNNINFHSIE
jgi:hypothetical protein